MAPVKIPEFMNRSILFDIDGTLLHYKGVGRQAFGVAFLEAYGVAYPSLESICFVGATDSNVVRTMTRECGAENSPAREEHFFMALARELDRDLARSKAHVYPGVPELLGALDGAGFVAGIVTGNIRPTAWSKLRHAGLDRFFRFGAYGDDHHDRDAITATAVLRAPPNAPVALMIGDTPLDIRAAKANRLAAVAVATGWIAAAELAEAGADLVLDNFADTRESLQRICALL